MWAELLNAGLGIASAYAGSKSSESGQRSANDSNLQIAREQMEFQERMSNTAHQREVKDLLAAGLNPILTATGGNGASSPIGSSATMVNTKQNRGELALNSAKSISDIMLARAMAKTEQTKQELNYAQTVQTRNLSNGSVGLKTPFGAVNVPINSLVSGAKRGWNTLSSRFVQQFGNVNKKKTP